jgi:hypothetical protein
MSILERNLKRYTVTQPPVDPNKDALPTVEFGNIDEIVENENGFAVKNFEPDTPLNDKALKALEKDIVDHDTDFAFPDLTPT